jgi:hypothetical protein
MDVLYYRVEPLDEIWRFQELSPFYRKDKLTGKYKHSASQGHRG